MKNARCFGWKGLISWLRMPIHVKRYIRTQELGRSKWMSIIRALPVWRPWRSQDLCVLWFCILPVNVEELFRENCDRIHPQVSVSRICPSVTWGLSFSMSVETQFTTFSGKAMVMKSLESETRPTGFKSLVHLSQSARLWANWLPPRCYNQGNNSLTFGLACAKIFDTKDVLKKYYLLFLRPQLVIWEEMNNTRAPFQDHTQREIDKETMSCMQPDKS